MKNLSELQMELRRLSAALEQLSGQVESLKEQDGQEDADFSALEELACRDPLENPSYKALPEPDRERYLRLLTTAAGLDGPLTLEQLYYLCRMTAGAGEHIPPKELCRMAYQTDRLDWKAAASGLKTAGNPLLLDLLMLCSLNGPASDNTLEFIAETAGLLKCREEDLQVISRLAASLLAMDFQAFMDIDAKKAYNELGYPVPEEWMQKSRVHCGRYWPHKKVKAKMKGIQDFKFFESLTTMTGRIEAARRIEEDCYAHDGQKLVSFKFVKDKEYAKVDEKSFDTPKCDPICAKGNGIVHYVPDKKRDGRFDVWVISAFDSLENLPAMNQKQEE